MITRSQLNSVSDRIRARGLTFNCYERGQWVYVRTEAEKDDRAVLFNGNTLECFSAETGSQCEANQFKGPCAHAWAALRRKEINKKSRATRAGKQEQRKAA